MVSGFFAGGVAQGFEAQLDSQSLMDYRQKQLQIQQQGQQNEQQRQLYTQASQAHTEMINHIAETVKQLRIAHPEMGEAQIYKDYVAPFMPPLQQLDKNMGRDPNATQATVTAIIARPPAQVTEKTLAEAKRDPTTTALHQSEIKKNEAQAANYQSLAGTPSTAPVAGAPPTPQPDAAVPSTTGQAVKDDTAVTKLPEGFQLPQGFTVPPGYTFPAMMAAAERYRKTGTFPPMSRSRQNAAFFQNVQNLAAAIDSFEGSDPSEAPKRWQQFKAEQIGIQRFLSGPQGNTIRSLNVVTDHLDTLKGLGEALNNNDFTIANQLFNRIGAIAGKPAPTNFDGAKQIVKAEVVKAIGVAGGGVAAEREAALAIDNSSSPAQLMGAINDVAKPLLVGQLGGLRQQFKVATGLPESKFDDMLYPSTRQFLSKKTQEPRAPGTSNPAVNDPLGLR